MIPLLSNPMSLDDAILAGFDPADWPSTGIEGDGDDAVAPELPSNLH